jgi:hypothetical protein
MKPCKSWRHARCQLGLPTQFRVMVDTPSTPRKIEQRKEFKKLGSWCALSATRPEGEWRDNHARKYFTGHSPRNLHAIFQSFSVSFKLSGDMPGHFLYASDHGMAVLIARSDDNASGNTALQCVRKGLQKNIITASALQRLMAAVVAAVAPLCLQPFSSLTSLAKS